MEELRLVPSLLHERGRLTLGASQRWPCGKEPTSRPLGKDAAQEKWPGGTKEPNTDRYRGIKR